MPETRRLKATMTLLKILGNKLMEEKIMKLKSCLYVSLCSAMALFTMTACSDDMAGGGDDSRPKGNGIVFGAQAGYVGTRTAYGDYTNGADGKPVSQEILWLEKDRVEVYSPTSPNKKKVEYEVTNLNVDDNGSAYLASYQGQDGLQWDFNSATQNFYAVYPSPASIKNQEMVQDHNIRFENGTLYGFIPINQEYRFTRDGSANGGWNCEPTMDWQYMAARIDDFTVPQDGTDGGINLNFKPLVTTLEITLQGPSAPLAQMNIDAPEGVKIMGEFSCDLTAGNWATSGTPTCNFVQSTSTEENRITINLYDTSGQPITLADGEYLTINVFLLPVEDLTNLTVRLAGYNTASRTLALNDGATDTEQGTPITLTPHKKTRVTIKAPNHIDGTNQWMGGLSDNVYVSQLSIPGTANTFSYGYTNSNNRDWYAAQTADIDRQWEAGIRCFEIKCPEVSGDLADSQVQCNRTNVGITFGDAVDAIWKKVQESVDDKGNPTEFAMIIPAYESGTGHPSDGNGVRNFMNALNTFYKNHSYNYKTYRPDITLGEVRGGLMFIARVTSEEDEDMDLPAPEQGVVVKGWGSLKDLWKRRGYSYPNWADNGTNYTQSMEYLMLNGNDYSSFSFNMPTKGATNFLHGTVRADGTSSDAGAYVQDWNRVSPESRNYQLWNHFGSYQYCYWPESYNEKITDVWNTFMKSIEDNQDLTGPFYINSLDGFFIDQNIPLSYKPYVAGREDGGWTWSYGYGDGGTAGNIADFATQINEDFFNRIQVYGPTNIYGPMNVVLLDRVYQNTDGSDPGSRLPSTIINNNFRFPLLVKPSETTNSADASYGNGGNVWK